ncbi:MAG: dynamin family protein [Phormidium sp.]
MKNFDDFQKYKKELTDNIGIKLVQIFQELNKHELKTDNLITKIENITQNLQSYRFRVTVVGEFSRGKSTLINALVGAEIQPVRAIACSGTITVLKYGTNQRIVCKYKNGQEKQVSFDEYKTLASISKQAALQHRSDELARSEIEEIVFEHPNFDLCRNGVEIADSPGLNEHPERAEITKKLLQNTDAVIFLTIADPCLSETERILIQELKTKISSNAKNQPAHNLFILVNKIDILDTEEDRQDVKDLVKEFALGKSPVVANKNRIHFISAKAAFNATVNNSQNEYLDAFRQFIHSLEEFLTSERGFIEFSKAASKFEEFSISGLSMLQEAEDACNLKIKESEHQKRAIIEKIGEVSGHGVKVINRVKQLLNEMMDKVEEDIYETWNDWIAESKWEEELQNKSNQWHSNKNLIFEQKEIIKDFVEQFIHDLSELINSWADKNIRKILQNRLEIVEQKINLEIQEFLQSSKSNEQKLNRNFNYQYGDYSHRYQEVLFTGDFINYIIGIVMAGVIGTVLLLLLQLFNPITIAIVVIAALITGAGFGIGGIYEQIKRVVFPECIKEFKKIQGKIVIKLIEHIDREIRNQIFNNQIKTLEEKIAQIITSYEFQLEEQEIKHKKLLEDCESEKAFIAQKRQQLEQVQKEIAALLTQATA